MSDNPVSRALLALEQLQASPGVTASRLAARLGVSERAARRYVEMLRAADIPIESVRGPYGGYRLGRGLRTPLVFSRDEAFGLVMAVLDGHHDPDDPTDAAAVALGKLVRALPEPVAAQVELVRRGASPAPDRAAARPDPAITLELVSACSNRTPVVLAYRSSLGVAQSLAVDPWAIVVRHGRWYLLCRSHSADALRAYRVDRVSAVSVASGAFSVPASLDPVAELEAHLASGWEYEVEVVIHAPLSQAGRCLPRTLGRLSAVDSSTTRLCGTTSNPYWYAEQLVAVPADFEIVACAELRSAVRAIGERLLRAAG